MKVFVSLALIVLFITASQSVVAVDRTGAIVGGKTEVYNNGMSVVCYAWVWVILLPVVLNITYPYDNVIVENRAYWWDNRTNANAPLAYHNFTLTVDYDHSYYGYDHHEATTRAQQSGSHTLSVPIYSPQENKDVNFTWTARSDVPGACLMPGYATRSEGFRLG
jgi:hypothetical protein